MVLIKWVAAKAFFAMFNYAKGLLLPLPGLQILTLIATVTLLVYYLTRRNSRHHKFLKSLPGPPSLPIIGAFLSYVFTPRHEFMSLVYSWYKAYGSLFVVWVGNKPIVACCGTKEVEALLSSSIHIAKSHEYDLLHKWLGHGLLTAKAPRWQTMRKLLIPTFHFKILEGFLPIFNEQADVLVGILKEQRPDNQPFDMFPYITRCALDIICETAMGVKLNSQQGQVDEGEYVKVVYRYGALLLHRFMRPWFRIDGLWKLCGYASIEDRYIKTLHSFTSKVIANKKREMEKRSTTVGVENQPGLNEKQRKAFLDLLLDVADAHNLTDTMIREETDTFMFEGHDTAAANLIWTIMNLSQFPKFQKLVQDELEEIFKGNRNGEITTAHISKMKYLDCCIKETLRMYPSVPFYFRHLTEDITIGDQVIPKGVSIAVADYLLHRDPENFPDPDVFKPERFLVEETSGGRNPYSFVPFSAGPRNCIGQKFALLEEKIILAKLFLNFNVKAIDKLDDIKMVPDIVLRPMNGVRIALSPR